MKRLRAVWEAWTIHGLPRCYAHFEGGRCYRLIWPWQATLGDGESLYHARCRRREQRWLDTYSATVGTL